MKKKRDCRNVNKGRQNKEKEEEMPSRDNTKKRRKDRGKREEVDLEIWGRKITIFFFHPVSICWLKLGIYPDMAETAPIQPVFKLKRNKSISILT